MTGTSAWIAADGVFRPSRRLEGDERQDHAVAPAEDLAVEDAVPWQRLGGADDLGVARADVVQVARVEAHLAAALVELGPDAVVLVLEPDLRAEPGDDLLGVLGGRGEHELERMEERQRRAREGIVAGEGGQLARRPRPASRPT